MLLVRVEVENALDKMLEEHARVSLQQQVHEAKVRWKSKEIMTVRKYSEIYQSWSGKKMAANSPLTQAPGHFHKQEAWAV